MISKIANLVSILLFLLLMLDHTKLPVICSTEFVIYHDDGDTISATDMQSVIDPFVPAAVPKSTPTASPSTPSSCCPQWCSDVGQHGCDCGAGQLGHRIKNLLSSSSLEGFQLGCERNYVIVFSGHEIRHLNASWLPPSNKNADFSNNRISRITDRFPMNLEFLNLAYNKLRILKGTYFPETLKIILLNHNFLSAISHQLPIGISMVDLSNNHLSAIDMSSYITLRWLDLSQNRISNVDNVIFTIHPNLTYLSLSGNELKSFPTKLTVAMPNLKQLELNDCHIAEVNLHQIEMPSLEFLSLRQNLNITLNGPPHGRSMNSLVEMDLSNTGLHTIDYCILYELKSLKTVHVFDNPMNCSCELEYLSISRQRLFTEFGPCGGVQSDGVVQPPSANSDQIMGMRRECKNFTEYDRDIPLICERRWTIDQSSSTSAYRARCIILAVMHLILLPFIC